MVFLTTPPCSSGGPGRRWGLIARHGGAARAWRTAIDRSDLALAQRLARAQVSARRLPTTALRRALDGPPGLWSLVLRAGADPNLPEAGGAGDRPLHRAASRGDGPQVNALLDAGADVHALTRRGHTPLDSALTGLDHGGRPAPWGSGRRAVVQRLLMAHAAAGKQDHLAGTLHRAEPDPELLATLLAAGACPHAPDVGRPGGARGEPCALFRAVELPDGEAWAPWLAAFAAHGVGPDARCSAGLPLVCWAVRRPWDDPARVLAALESHGHALHDRGRHGESVLHAWAAAPAPQGGMLQALLERPAVRALAGASAADGRTAAQRLHAREDAPTLVGWARRLEALSLDHRWSPACPREKERL